MGERPILFSAPMVRALLDGRKTQTRRVVKLPPQRRGHWEATDLSGPGVRDRLGRPVTSSMPTLAHSATGACVVAPYEPGDRLWVRETWYCDHFECTGAALRTPTPAQRAEFTRPDMLIYRADGTCCEQFGECDHSGGVGSPWRPSIHMPRWASRLTLEVTGVRVERLQAISEEDARAEGCPFDEPPPGKPWAWFRKLWMDINGADSWKANPWVWVVEFKRVTP